MRNRIAVAVLFAAAMGIGGPALADDLLLSKGDATDLIDSNIGKPFWQMEAQCAGMMGAAYAYNMDHHRSADAERSKEAGIAMLNEAIARLQIDRGIDQPAALNLAAVEVETGRASGRQALERQGSGPQSYFNYIRSACYDISAAQRRHMNR